MERNKLIAYCKYYKGQPSSPFKHSTKEDLFWGCESQYVENAERSEDFHSWWKAEAERYIKRNPKANNLLTAKNISIETKGIILYIESMLMKWMPYQVDMIFEY